jgi:hypothetical protein
MRLRFPLAVLLGAGVYLFLLQVSYGFLRSSYIAAPQWWVDHLHPHAMTSASWFIFINASGAILAALPVGLAVAFFAKTRSLALSLLIGVPPGLYIMGGGLLEYGLPHYTAAWVIDALQFLSISLAVLVIVVTMQSRPLTTRSSGR